MATKKNKELIQDKGLYIVSEPATLLKGSGANRHIEVGQYYLNKHFNISFYSLCEIPTQNKNKILRIVHENKGQVNFLKKTFKKIGLWHTIKDLKILHSNHKNILNAYKTIKEINPSFIYERSSFLNFSGLIISKLLNIPHFYENNGIKYLEHQENITSWLTWLWAILERKSYKKSDFVFFVGLWGNRLNLPTKNWMNIENGIEEDYIDRFEYHQKKIGGVINICFIGSLMKYHGFGLLVNALKGIDTSNIHLHLFGSKLESVVDELNDIVKTTYYGFLDREELAKRVAEMHIGIVPNARDYQSQMKLFDYGAAKCLVIAPDLKNLKYWFNEEEICFFRKDEVNSLKKVLKRAINNPQSINSMGEKIYLKIREGFTWDKIFIEKSKIINSFLE
jgi:glycosyltransferase involved in cell wall biosynthesis